MLILSGDHLYRMDYRKLIAFHRETDADITICVHPVRRDQASRMGLVRADRKGCVSEFVEKPQDADVIERFTAPPALFAARGLDLRDGYYLASMGNYVFQPEVLRELLRDTDKTDFGREVIPASLASNKVMAYPFADYWADIGTIGSYYEANLDLARAEPSFSIYQANWPFFTRTRSLPPSRIIGSEIRDCLVVEGSDIEGATIANSIIGMRSNVRCGSVLDGVVMLGSDFYEGESLLEGSPPSDDEPADAELPPLGIGCNCRIERAIIDKNARIGEGVVIRPHTDVAESEGPWHWVRDGITIIPKGTVIPPGTEF
jgi:glucose-1-phosphate adenylyltransferase